MKCQKVIDSDYRKEHIKRSHGGDSSIKFTPVVNSHQSRLGFAPAPVSATEPTTTPSKQPRYDDDHPQTTVSETADSEKVSLAVVSESCPFVFSEPLPSTSCQHAQAEDDPPATGTDDDHEVSPDVSDGEGGGMAETPSKCNDILLGDGPSQPIKDKYNPQKFHGDK